MSSELTPTQRLAMTRAQLVQALRDPAWLLLLKRWLENKTPSAPASVQACATKKPNGGKQKESV